MKLMINENEVIDVSRLYTVTDFARKTKFNYSTIRYRMGIGDLQSVVIAGVPMVIEPEGVDYKKKRKAGRKPREVESEG